MIRPSSSEPASAEVGCAWAFDAGGVGVGVGVLGASSVRSRMLTPSLAPAESVGDCDWENAL